MAREPLLLVALAALTGASLWLRDGEAPPAATTTPTLQQEAPPSQTEANGAAAATGDLATQNPSAAEQPAGAEQLELPDGTFVKTLNGATNPKPLAEYWGTQIPWSPIVGVEHNDQGVAWYRHENGSFSTTETRWDSAGKRQVTLTRVAHQGPAAPAIAPRK